MAALSGQSTGPTREETAQPVSSESLTSEADKTSQLSSLTASARAQYAGKRYEAAAETYSDAIALQDELNGEMSVLNADLFYEYGRCLFHIAMSKSDVLGGTVPGERPPERPRKKLKTQANGSAEDSAVVASNGTTSGITKLGEEVMERAVEQKESMKADMLEQQEGEKPYFQFKGDENLEESDEDADDIDGEEADGEGATAEAVEQDDFADAFEILDIARVLLSKKLDALGGDGKGKSTAPSHEERQIKERLADVHDLQAEVSLENERFPEAVKDLRSALSIKQEFEPKESKYLAELHYKLALALEFASITTSKDADGDASTSSEGTEAQVDKAMREEAARELELAIESCKLRIEKEEARLGGLDEKARKAAEKDISEVKSICDEMQQRLADLSAPLEPSPSSLAQATDPALRGILASLLGESPAAQKARIEEATRGANDLTGLVKHKRKDGPAASAERNEDEVVETERGRVDADEARGAKRKADGDHRVGGAGADGGVNGGTGKRARVEGEEGWGGGVGMG